MDLKEAGQISGKVEDHWYYRAKLAAVESACLGSRPSSVLDVGAGLGFFSRALLKNESIRRATCVDPGYATDSDEEVNGKPLHHRRIVEDFDADLVLMMDVVEHVADDIGLVAEYTRKARVGTMFLLTAPAFPWLWSGHDDYLEHHRRYTLSSLERVVREAGLSVDLGCYMYGALLPVVAASRWGQRILERFGRAPSSQMRDHGPTLNILLDRICRWEASFAFRNRIGGVTALVRAQKLA